MARAKKDETLMDADGNPCATLEEYWQTLKVPPVTILDKDAVLRILSAVALDPVSPPPSRVRAAEICAKMQGFATPAKETEKKRKGLGDPSVQRLREVILGMESLDDADEDDDGEDSDDD